MEGRNLEIPALSGTFPRLELKETPLAGAADRSGHTLAARWPQEYPFKYGVAAACRTSSVFYFFFTFISVFQSSFHPPSPIFSPFQPFHGVKIRRRDPQSLPDAADCWLPNCLPDPAKLPPNSIPFVSPHKRCPFFSASCGWHVPTSGAHTYA